MDAMTPKCINTPKPRFFNSEAKYTHSPSPQTSSQRHSRTQGFYGDRYIPYRTLGDLKVSKNMYSLFNAVDESKEATPKKSSPQKLHESALADALLGESEHSKGFFQFNNKLQEPVASSPACKLSHQRHCSVKNKRIISSDARKVLHAPGLLSNPKFNLIDWNVNNKIAIALKGEILIMNFSTMEITELDVSEPECDVTNVSWSSDGRFLAIAYSNQIKLYDSLTLEETQTFCNADYRVTSLAWNGCSLSSAWTDGLIHTHDSRIAKSCLRYAGHKGEIHTLKWSPCGRYLASSGRSKTVIIWDNSSASSNISNATNAANVPNSTILHKLKGHEDSARAVSWCTFRKNILASGGGRMDCTIKFWNIQNGKLIHEVDCGYEVLGLDWSMHCNDIISFHGGREKNLVVWNYPSMAQVAERDHLNDRILYYAKSPDGCSVLTAGDNELISVWDIYKSSTQGKVAKRRIHSESDFSRHFSSLGAAIR